MASTPTPQRDLDVVIVGGGFSGTALAINLLRRTSQLSLAIVDRESQPGRGVAYSSRYNCHLLNVTCGGMSALPEDPDHFLRWARAHHGPARESDFLPRNVYGQYVGSVLEETLADRPDAHFRWIRDDVVCVRRTPSGLNVGTAHGTPLSTRALVLATGNYPPARLNFPGLDQNSERYVASPWSANPLPGIPATGNVLLIGSGLTSVDVVLALHSHNFGGRIHILSRHGLMPQTHRQTPPWAPYWSEQSPRTARGLLRMIREEARKASATGFDWRAVIDALRPATAKIWQSLPPAEQKRFLRHARAYWEVHRHRIAPEIGTVMAALMQEGRIRLHAGRVTNYREHSDCVAVQFRDRKSGAQQELRVDRVINCTGPETDFRRIDVPLIKSLFAQGLARPDRLFLGLDVDASGALLDSSGVPSSVLFALGPARKGALWESMAVPEIRNQASQLAGRLVGTLQRSNTTQTPNQPEETNVDSHIHFQQ